MLKIILSKLRRNYIPGSISIDGCQIKNLQILKRNYKPGMSKAGAVSLSGTFKDQKVKIYSTRSLAQTNLITALGYRLRDSEVKFPTIIAKDQNYIAEKWISGINCSKLNSNKLVDPIRSILYKFQNEYNDIVTSEVYKDAFDYLGDYLVERIKPWIGLYDLKDIQQDWLHEFEISKNTIEPKLSHPDLSPNNLILSNNGNIYVIDNELVGIGNGWILDIYNSNLDIKFNQQMTPFEVSFRDRSILLRRIGSALDSGSFNNLRRINDEYKKRFI
jgi:thiamine kinase-like enzyme